MGCKQFSANQIVPSIKNRSSSRVLETDLPAAADETEIKQPVIFRSQTPDRHDGSVRMEGIDQVRYVREKDDYSDTFTEVASTDSDDIQWVTDNHHRSGLINYNGRYFLTRRSLQFVRDNDRPRTAMSDSRLLRPQSSGSTDSFGSPRIRSVSPQYPFSRMRAVKSPSLASLVTKTSRVPSAKLRSDDEQRETKTTSSALDERSVDNIMNNNRTTIPVQCSDSTPVQKMLMVMEENLRSASSILSEPDYYGRPCQSVISSDSESF